jgi:hypothetical protein
VLNFLCLFIWVICLLILSLHKNRGPKNQDTYRTKSNKNFSFLFLESNKKIRFISGNLILQKNTVVFPEENLNERLLLYGPGNYVACHFLGNEKHFV